MPMPSAVVRQTRVRHKIRTDLWPDAPQLPESFVNKFPELAQFNEDLKDFVEKIRNSTEPEGLNTADIEVVPPDQLR